MRSLAALLWVALLFAISPVRADDGWRWTTSWATSPMRMDGDNALPGDAASEIEVRQTARLSIGGALLRVRLTNRDGTRPLRIVSLDVGRAAAAGVLPAGPDALRRATFGGEGGVTIPAGADYVSDPVDLRVDAGAQIALIVRAATDGGPATGHPGARTTGRVTRAGAAAVETTRWYFVAAIDVVAQGGAAVAVLGDSITDGYGVATNSDRRWTDYLAERLRSSPATRHLAVANLGIGGNRLLLDGLGPNAVARYDRELPGLAAVTHLILLIGVNDLGTLTRDAPVDAAAHAALVARMLAGYRQIVARARAAGITVLGGTITPFGGSAYYHPDAATEADRQAINTWLRSPGAVDGVIDFDAALRDRDRPDRLAAGYDNDGLHPSDAGYRAMAAAVPLERLAARSTPVVLTFDDLPEHGPLPAGTTAADVARSITATLRRHGVDEAYGFVNGTLAARDPRLAQVLSEWRRAGQPLANHGWSHGNLDALGAPAFANEVTRNEALLERLADGTDWRYFRYPYLAEGATPAARDAARGVLAERGYRIAPVSLDFSDWKFNAAFGRCVALGDGAAITQLEDRFLAVADAAFAASTAVSRSRYGRAIPQVALLHAGAFTARMLPRLLDLYRMRGARFVPLGAAIDDPAYAASRDPTLAGATNPLAAAPPATGDIDGMCAAAR